VALMLKRLVRHLHMRHSWRSRAVDQSLILESAEAVAKSGVPLSG
jgi:hypothetical protein